MVASRRQDGTLRGAVRRSRVCDADGRPLTEASSDGTGIFELSAAVGASCARQGRSYCRMGRRSEQAQSGSTNGCVSRHSTEAWARCPDVRAVLELAVGVSSEPALGGGRVGRDDGGVRGPPAFTSSDLQRAVAGPMRGGAVVVRARGAATRVGARSGPLRSPERRGGRASMDSRGRSENAKRRRGCVAVRRGGRRSEAQPSPPSFFAGAWMPRPACDEEITLCLSKPMTTMRSSLEKSVSSTTPFSSQIHT